jgi:hypothetical protein
MTARTAPTIALGPTGNQRGSHYFLSLRHGRVLRRTRWDELSMSQDVIDRVSAIGHLQGMPQTLTFADAYDRELSDTDFDVDDEHDDNYVFEPADDVSLEYDSVDDLPAPDVNDSDLPVLADNQDDDVGEDGAHYIVVSDTDSMDSSDFNDSVLDEDNFGDDEAAMDGQKAGVDVAEIFVDHREAVDGQKAGVDVDAITECTESNEQHATGPNLRPRGAKKDPTHILRGYGNNDFLFALIDADASFATDVITTGSETFSEQGS